MDNTEKTHPFRRYVNGLKSIVNNDVDDEQAINMLVQQIVTKPIFEKLFAKDGFVMKNPVSRYIDDMLSAVHAQDGLKDIQETLDKFYHSVETTLNGIDTTDGKQKVITALYEKFFKNAFKKDQSINGIVYTPQEIVDFIIHSCVGVLKDEFGIDINQEDVNILDPFTGTGTFIARLLESGVISKENIARKYMNELYANEITLLAYYIANVNIENTYQRVTGNPVYTPFNNILLTDTFNIEEICKDFGTQLKIDQQEYFGKNKARIRKEYNTPITVIMGNPPYGANQKSANDNAKKRKYQSGIDKRISDTYLDDSLFSGKKGLIISVYDNYVRAFRWASDRIGDNDGIIAFITPNGWMTGSVFEGFRKCIQTEFSKAYVFDLRGDGAGTYKKEGDNVFVYGSNRGCKTGVAITLLVKKVNSKVPFEVHYCDIMTLNEGYHVLEKRATVAKNISFMDMKNRGALQLILPKPNGDWLVERSEVFGTLIPLAGDTHKKFAKHDEDTIFVGYSNGYMTNRDAWVYNFSKKALDQNIRTLVEEYESQLDSPECRFVKDRIKWTAKLQHWKQNRPPIEYESRKIHTAIYRPFCKMNLYVDEVLIENSSLMDSFYAPGEENLCIAVSGVGVKKAFSCIITNCKTDREIVGKSQCFPLKWYENSSTKKKNSAQLTLVPVSAESIIVHEGISDFALQHARTKYAQNVSKEDIFFYVYGYLHSPEYRNAFANDLRYHLPNIGFVDTYEEFLAFSNAGRKLAELHLNYESVPLYQDVKLTGHQNIEQLLANPELLRVKKMKLDEQKHILVYNENVTIMNIPDDAFRYLVNGKSALAGIVEQYLNVPDRESGIVSDPNEYAGPEYIFKLVLSIITVSVETMKIVDNLPKLHFDSEDKQ